MKVLITGGTGFIGRHTLAALARADHQVLAIYRGAQPTESPGILWLKSSLDQPNWGLIKEFMCAEPFTVVHLAAHGVDPRKADWEGCFHWNVSETLRFWLNAKSHGAIRIVTCGTCFEYGSAADRYDWIPTTAALEPLGPYAASKAAATMALHALTATSGLTSLSIRPCVAFGEGEGEHRLWPSLRRAALAGEDFPMTNGSQIRDFVPVEKVALALADGVLRNDLPNGRLIIENVGSGRAQSVQEFASQWWKHWHANGELLIGALPSREGEANRFVPLTRSSELD
jgi:UDP-glucose 4-epimerase